MTPGTLPEDFPRWSPPSDAKRANQIAVASLLVALAVAIFSGLGGFAHNDSDLKQRLTAVETKQEENKSRMERMENKLDRLIELVGGAR